MDHVLPVGGHDNRYQLIGSEVLASRGDFGSSWSIMVRFGIDSITRFHPPAKSLVGLVILQLSSPIRSVPSLFPRRFSVTQAHNSDSSDITNTTLTAQGISRTPPSLADLSTTDLCKIVLLPFQEDSTCLFQNH